MQHCTCCVLLAPLQCAVCLPAAHCLPTLTVQFLPVLPDCDCAGGGGVHVFSGMHASGEQLNQLTGIAAILRFPLPDLEDAEFEDAGGW